MVETNGTGGKAKVQGRHLVRATAAKMRDLVFAEEPDTLIGSLPELARLFGVGIVTVQQAARILEHEGLLEVRRGPGGGYYGTRPDQAALERSMGAYLHVHASGYQDALEMITLLDCELAEGAAACTDEALRQKMRALQARIDLVETGDQRVAFEEEMHDVIFAMVDRPLIELLARVTMRHSKEHPVTVFDGEAGAAAWKSWRHKVIRAILQNDGELARFEVTRHRRDLLARLRAHQAGIGAE